MARIRFLVNDKGSSISFEDYAIATVDELEKPEPIHQRFTLGYGWPRWAGGPLPRFAAARSPGQSAGGAVPG